MSSSISKNKNKSFKSGHFYAKILVFRTHHVWNSTTEMTLDDINPTNVFFFFLFRFKVKSQLENNKNASKRKECWAWWIKHCNQTQLCFSKVPFIYYVRTTCIAQNLIWLLNFSPKLYFFVKTKWFIFQHYTLTKFSCWTLTFFANKEEKNCSKKSWKCWG